MNNISIEQILFNLLQRHCGAQFVTVSTMIVTLFIATCAAIFIEYLLVS